jgi:amidase
VRRIPRSDRVFSYSAEHPPAAHVEPGETILVETKNAFGDQTFEPGETLEDLSLDGADPLTGPLFVEGAEPGDALAVTIEHIETVGPGMQGVIPDFGILENSVESPGSLHWFVKTRASTGGRHLPTRSSTPG